MYNGFWQRKTQKHTKKWPFHSDTANSTRARVPALSLYTNVFSSFLSSSSTVIHAVIIVLTNLTHEPASFCGQRGVVLLQINESESDWSASLKAWFPLTPSHFVVLSFLPRDPRFLPSIKLCGGGENSLGFSLFNVMYRTVLSACESQVHCVLWVPINFVL